SEYLAALLALVQAVQHDKPEQQLPEPIELPPHIQTLITNHINQVLQQKPQGHQSTVVLTGHVPQVGKAGAAVPHLDLLPPHVHAPHQPVVINHQADSRVGPQIVFTLPGDIGDKVNKLQQHVGQVMLQAEQHIPSAVNQAIKQREQLQAQKSPQPEGRLLASGAEAAAQVPQLLERQRELQERGKCSFQCPEKALPVCATNGKCTVEFPGQCELSQWNCFNTKNVFRQVQDDDCQRVIKCYDRDML
ncbi:hypothetical protein KR222_004367, partial [Zaprionus bogoriensis]